MLYKAELRKLEDKFNQQIHHLTEENKKLKNPNKSLISLSQISHRDDFHLNIDFKEDKIIELSKKDYLSDDTEINIHSQKDRQFSNEIQQNLESNVLSNGFKKRKSDSIYYRETNTSLPNNNQRQIFMYLKDINKKTEEIQNLKDGLIRVQK